jgi:uncharacterized phiE125 gp8 family phage protein
MILNLKTAPVIEPVDLDELKNHLRLDSALEDATLASYLAAARQHLESLCGPLITQTWQQYEQDWPCRRGFDLWKPRAQAVASIKYTDLDGVQATVDAVNYYLSSENPCRAMIALTSAGTWPSVTLRTLNPIEIEYVCGYGDESDSVPEPIRLAILLLATEFYESRRPVANVTGTMQELPFAVTALISNYRVWGF